MIPIIVGLLVILLGCFFCLHAQHEIKYGHLRKIFPGMVWTLNFKLGELADPNKVLQIQSFLIEKYKSSVMYLMYPHAKLMVIDLKLIDLILSTNMDKTVEYSFIKSWLSDGILTAKAEKWKIHKKQMAPAFNINNLQQHIDVINEQSKILCYHLQKAVGQSLVNIYKYVNLCAMDVILNTALGADINIQDNPSSEYMKNANNMCNILYLRGLTYYRFYWAYYFTSHRKKEQSIAKMLNDFSAKFIEERKSGKTQSGVKTILDMVLENGEYSDEDIRSEINTIIFAGHETTSATISFALYELGRNPEIQKKVYDEIMEVVGDGNPTYNDLEQLTYTSMVLKEVLRLYPGVPMISRRITKDITWENRVLPTGLECYISIYHIQRLAEHFPEPEKFDPERFNEENVKKIPPGAYIPFSVAPRGCIGQKFAQLEMKTILVHILRQFEILPDAGHKLNLVIKVTLKANNGVNVYLKNRKKLI